MKQLGLDIGSTTLKYVLLDEENQLLSCKYQRHGAKIGEKLDEILCQFETDYPGEELILTVSGSAGLGLSESLDLPFVQEVFAEKIAAQRFCPGTDVIIELGGEDAKILFLTGGFEMRMNGTCAGGTGAFIDQMASLMQITPLELNDLAAKAQTIPPIASRCGVFAKSDIQPLLNQGARREDVAAGILRAVVNQTVAGLAQGREITGKLLYLGGPLTFLPELRRSFDEVLNTTGLCPENSLYFVAYGCALANVGQIVSPAVVRERLALRAKTSTYRHQPPLFASKSDYEAFSARHQKNSEGKHHGQSKKQCNDLFHLGNSSIQKFYHPARFCPHLKYIPIVTGVCAFVYRILDFIFLEIFSHVKSARIILVTFHKNQQLVSHFVPVCSISAKYCIFPADFSLCAAVRVLWTSPKLLNQTKRLPSGFQS